MRRCFGFSGFAGFFGLIGIAFLVESAHRRKAKKANDSIRLSRPPGSKRFQGWRLLVLVLSAIAVFAVILTVWTAKRAEKQRLIAIGSLQSELRNRIAELLGDHRMTYSSSRFYMAPDSPHVVVILGGFRGRQ